VKTAILAGILSLVAFDAFAIVRYLVQDMTCDEVHRAVERDGAVILYRKAAASGLPLYDRYVSGPGLCGSNEEVVRSSVATADTPSCDVRQCRPVDRSSR